MKFYVYEWFVSDTNEVFYVGKGCKYRYKSRTRRNKIFKIYLENFNCDSRILRYFNSEDEAFMYEHQRILALKNINQAKANLDYGGKGGCHFVWTEEMRKYQSTYNPMKIYEQRQRMSENNPMKNPEVVKRVSEKLKKPVILNDCVYKSVKEASQKTGHTEWTITKWCRRGYDYSGNPCRYANENQKEIPELRKLHPNAATPKAVIVDNVRFETVEDGAKYIGVWSESLIRAIKENRKCKGHTCRYVNQQPSTNLKD